MADWQEAAHGCIIALVFSFMVAKLLSLINAFRAENLRVQRAPSAPAAVPDDALLASQLKNGNEGDLDLSDDDAEGDEEVEEEEDDSTLALDLDRHKDLDWLSDEDTASTENDSVDQGMTEGCSKKDAVLEESKKLEHVMEETSVAEEEQVVEHDSDDWEGVESSELEEEFAAASTFVATVAAGSGLKITYDLQLQLYALYKIATEGPCRTPQPSLINMTARAKWNAWQKLGNTSPEEAMVRYIEVLSKAIPEWNQVPDEKNKIEDAANMPQSSGSSVKQGGVGGPVFSTLVSEEDGGEMGSLDPIHACAKDGNKTGILQLLEQGQAVDEKDTQGRTALHWGVDHGHLDTVSFLLLRGAEVNAKDREGQTPLHYATICEHESVAKHLIEQGADPYIHDNDGVTPSSLRPRHWDWMPGGS